MRKKITKKIPRKPKIDNNPMIQREERISKCELLMLKMGTYTQAKIARELGVNIDTARNYIACVIEEMGDKWVSSKTSASQGCWNGSIKSTHTGVQCQILENEKSRPEVKSKH